MADDRTKRFGGMYKRHQTSPGTPVGVRREPVESDDEPTPLPVSAEEAHSWQHVGSRVSRLELYQQSIAQSFPRFEGLLNEFVIPGLKDLMAQVDGLLQRQERNNTRLELFFDDDWPELTKLVGALTAGLARVEKKQDEFVAALALHNDRIVRAEKRLDEIERQLDIIGLERRDRGVIAAERRRWLSWGKAAYALAVAAAGAAGYLVSQLNL